MHSDIPAVKATVIVSIYRDIGALEVILHALAQQSENNFCVIISEDGEDAVVAEYLQRQSLPFPLRHLTQTDKGFRKNRALNRAILNATTDTLIFIDGDCVPHPRFIEAHLRYAAEGHVYCGRRIELGPEFSAELRTAPEKIQLLANPVRYLLLAKRMHRDGIKNYELGFHLGWLQPLLMHRSIAIVGCNFSAQRSDLIAINGFNEEYEAPGIGEDTDIEWRLRQSGVVLHDIRVTALQYHLYHPRNYAVPAANRELLAKTRAAKSPFCSKGINQHINIETTVTT